MMKLKQKAETPLSPADSKFIENLLSENQKLIRIMLANNLAPDHRFLMDDAIGEFLLLMCKKVDKLKVHTNPAAWIIIAAKYVAIDVKRRYIKNSWCTTINGKEIQTKNFDVFEEVLYATWLEDDVPKKLLSLLTKREAEVYQKLYVEKKKVKEVAAEFGTTDNTVRNLHKRIRDKISKAIKENKF